MPFTLDVLHEDSPHKWSVVKCICNVADENDKLIVVAVDELRAAYGEEKILDIAQSQMAGYSRSVDIDDSDLGVGSLFDELALKAAIRRSYPDPDAEGNKPEQLTNTRSEVAEIVARCALRFLYHIKFPVSPQAGKTNANMPILGFDGWGLLQEPNLEYTLVLVQVKGTDDIKRPPGEAQVLIKECSEVTKKTDELCRALCCLLQIVDSQYTIAIISMLELLGRNELPNIAVAPVLIRGLVEAHMDDLKSLRHSTSAYSPAVALGASVSIGLNLYEFGRAVMIKSRKI